jgi:ATP-dependent DNA helicase RecQ
MLMLTFSRAAATEFKTRLMTLIGNAANFIQITTFHSYCFDLLGKVGNVEKSDTILTQTVEKIKAGGVDRNRLTKTVLVIDEAQDMSAAEFALVKMLMALNEEMRVIAVGDDDQNIYEFRKSDSTHFASLLDEPNAAKYELVENYRSCSNIVALANRFALKISKRLKKVPILPVVGEPGQVSVTRLVSPFIEVPVVQTFLRRAPSGSTCIITRKNEEALNILGLLSDEGIHARLIRSNDGFNLLNLMEIRDFTTYLNGEGYAVTEGAWTDAKAMLSRKYTASANLPWLVRMLGNFEATHNKTKYKSDFIQFVRESKMEDFFGGNGSVRVSTIHQTKGKEFDNIYLALGPAYAWDDAAKRAVYVALTRAKKELHVFACDGILDGINIPGITRYTDDRPYAAPNRIFFSLGLKDVQLGFEVFKTDDTKIPVSGQPLEANKRGCLLNGREIIRFSKRFLDFIDDLYEKGYEPKKAQINHIVFWRDKDNDVERIVPLPGLEFHKR